MIFLAMFYTFLCKPIVGQDKLNFRQACYSLVSLV
jgi:hypothetical protein